MSIYGSVLFGRAPMLMLIRMAELDEDLDFRLTFYSFLDTVRDTLTFYNVAKKASRKVCRLRDVFWNLAYDEYHDDTDHSFEPDRIQSYNFGRMEIFV